MLSTLLRNTINKSHEKKLQNFFIFLCFEKFYKNQFKKLVEKLEKTENFEQKLDIIKNICEDVGLKYVISVKYKNYFKNVSQYNIYQYRKWLGVKLFEHYDGIVKITMAKINELIKLYKDILTNKNNILDIDIPYKILFDQIEIVK